MQTGVTAPTPEYLYHTVFAGHDNDEFNVVRDSSSNFSTWSFRIKCAKKQRTSHFSALIEAAERISLLHIFTFEVNRRGERDKHEKAFFALPGERMLFGGQYGAPNAQAKKAAAAASDARDAACAAGAPAAGGTYFEVNSDMYDTETDSETECAPAQTKCAAGADAPPPKRARIASAMPTEGAAQTVPLAYMRAEVDYARAETERVRADGKEREAELKAEIARERFDAKEREAELKAEIARVRAERAEDMERLRADLQAAREAADNANKAMQRLQENMNAARASCQRSPSGGNLRRVEIVLDHAKGHYSRFATHGTPPQALGMTDVQASGCFTVRHCESLLLEQQPDLKDSGARAREVFRLVTHGRYLPPTGTRGKEHGVEIFFGEGCVALYSGEDRHGVKWERDNDGGWRVAARV
jgi:hypothetical protein